uniref:UDP-glycosyltransferase 2 n=1 Tax=Pueraria montana var. lobata TaxID=3893 RepID=UGT2_PUEML|nr:RecName: Full=UDP-glycosyltransferase 2; Short=PlUGT2; AltName: Full=UDP-glucose:isoflavone 4' 7-O-glucosyltransferase [Pueraria montana var. lobata]AMQ26112.1 UDP-glucose:isoflavone 4' 7-O-glucosyltransferase [Pueraria montana var. lobata]
MKDTIVLYPNIGRGHLVSMVELGKLILTHHPSLSITILILTPSTTPSTTTFACDSNAQYIATVTATIPAITFHHVPLATLPSNTPSLPPHLVSLELARHSTQNVAVAFQTLAKASNLKAIIIDLLNFNDPKTLTQNLNKNIHTYFYYTSGASTLALLLHYPTIHETLTKNYVKDQPLQIQIPGLRANITTDDFAKDSKDPSNYSSQAFLKIAETMRGSFGIIINTFEAIEEELIRALSEDGTVPPLFCIGPVISAPYGEDDKGCLSWLDSQPSQSVVLLCFGSMGSFSRTQLKEIAVGLEKSEQRFLWVVRAELDCADSVDEQPSLDELMPGGFLERTKEKGLVVRDWAPQVQILSHDSVGGFVTHCGWNSVLEAVCEGVPMAAWPLYAEQRVNRVIMVEDMKVALAVNEDKAGFVSATELGDRVRELMESDKGKEIRQRTFKMKISAAEAMAEGGTSRVALDKLAKLWKES